MADSRFYQFLYSKDAMLTRIKGSFTVGATGAVGTTAGKGVLSVTRKTTGIYEVKLSENYAAFVDFDWHAAGGVTGANVASGSLVTNTQYQITAVGTTTWSTAGFDSDFTPAVGSVFVATGTASGTGTAKAITSSGIASIEIAQSASAMLQNNVSGHGSAFFLQTYDKTNALADPTSGCLLAFAFWLRNSTVTF